jgi:hypothetical protein
LNFAVAYFELRRFHRNAVRTINAMITPDVTSPTYVLALSASRPVELPSRRKFTVIEGGRK